MTEKTRAALIGGVTLGLLSAIPPISLGNMCCCVWVLGGGVLAGLVGTVVSHSIGIPLGLILGDTFNEYMVRAFESMNPQAGEEVRRAVMQAQAQTFAQKLPVILGTAVFNSVIYIAFATLGGLLGVKLFEKRVNTVDNATPPPPPSDFGGSPPPPPNYNVPPPPPPPNFNG